MSNTGIRKDITRAIQNAPLPSATATRLIQLISQTEYDLDEVLAVIKMDTGMTSHILRVVNSAAFNLLKPVNTIDRAIVYIGAWEVLEIGLMNLSSFFRDKKLTGYQAEARDLWRHDLRTAIAARELTRRSSLEIYPELAFTAGLLHDIGKIVLSDFFPLAASRQASDLIQQQGADFIIQEKKLLGINHAEAGAELAAIWKLPGSLQAAIHHHHHPSRADQIYKPLVFLIHLADILAMMDGYGSGVDILQYSLDPSYLDYYNFSSDEIGLVQFKVEEEFQKMEAKIGTG
ncbi:MAG: HDOD domain-containing protein [Desulfohalobiaceae bacterium]|nr:HDOD domain-containing protein [Desulfohalobiaceae bacterium]